MQKNKQTLWPYSQNDSSIFLGCFPHSHSNGEKLKEHIVSFWVLSIPCPLCQGFSSPGNLRIKEANQPSAEQHVQNTRFSDLGQSLSCFQSQSQRVCRSGLTPEIFPQAFGTTHCSKAFYSPPRVPLGYRHVPAVSGLFSAGCWLRTSKWGSGQYFSTECFETLFRSRPMQPNLRSVLLGTTVA